MLSINADGRLVFAVDEESDDCAVVGVSLSMEKGKSGSLQFTLLPNHYLYDSIVRMKTTVTVMDDDRCIFIGRVLHLTTDTYKQRVVYCEGALSFLTDAVIENNLSSRTLKQIFEKEIQEYNELVDDNRKFTIGNVTIDKYETMIGSVNSSRTFNDALSTLNSDIIDYVNGYLSVRYENDTLYLDWLKDSGHTCNQVIRFGTNIISYSRYDPSDTIYTMLFPTTSSGLTIETRNHGSKFLPVSEELVNEYGRIYKAVQFDNVSDSQKLYEKAVEYNEKHAIEQPEEITITAIDLASLGINVDEIHIGDRVRIVSIPHQLDDYYICQSIRMPNLAVPGKTEYKFQNIIQDFKDPEAHIFSPNESSEKTLTEKTVEDKNKNTTQINTIKSAVDRFITEVDGTLTAHDTNIKLLAGKQIDLEADVIKLAGDQIVLEADIIDIRANDIVRIDAAVADIGAENIRIGGRVDVVEGIANDALAKTVTIGGQTVVIEGQLTSINSQLTTIQNLYAEVLAAQEGFVSNFEGNYASFNDLTSTSIDGIEAIFTNLYASSLAVSDVSFGGYSMTVNGKEVGTVLATAPISFKLSDMPGYADAIKAAKDEGKAEGRADVHVAKIERLPGTTYDEKTRVYTIPVLADTNYPGSNTSMDRELTLTASEAFQAGRQDIIIYDNMRINGSGTYLGEGQYELTLWAEASNFKTQTKVVNFDASAAYADGGGDGPLRVTSAESYFTVQAGSVYLITVYFSNGTSQTTRCTIKS